MNIVQVNNFDLIGRRFNGHDLQLSLNKLEYNANQIVVEKHGSESTTIPLYDYCDKKSILVVKSFIYELRNQLGMHNLIDPFGKAIFDIPEFNQADVVHYHLIHNNIFSILDFSKLVKIKPSVWTVHDPWVVTGHCVHPIKCERWKKSCLNCSELYKAKDMWKIKKNIYKEVDIDIVVASNFMKKYIEDSYLTSHFNKLHKIPFGIEVEKFTNTSKIDSRIRTKIPIGDFSIGFRSDKDELKGLKYIIEMLEKMEPSKDVTIITLGDEKLPSSISEKYNTVELGWQNDLNMLYDFYAACDVFLMPSLAESFGLMAIEAMASGCPIIVFEETVLTEITFAPECGIAVPYKNSDMLKEAVERLIQNPDECHWRGERGKELANKHYQYNDYVKHHIDLYREILDRKEVNDRDGR